MQAVNINELLIDPLAGFLPVVKMNRNAETFIEGIVTRLRVCMHTKTAMLIYDQIVKESKLCGIDQDAYVINELLYEYRIAGGSVQTLASKCREERILNDMIQKVISMKGNDAGLDFLNVVKGNRGIRKRSL